MQRSLIFAFLLIAPLANALTCDVNATTANFATQLAATTPGQTLCLATGNYGTFSGVSKSSPGVRIMPQPGASPTMTIQFATVSPAISWLIFDGTGGTFTISTGYISGPAHDITFTGGIIVRELDYYLGPNNNVCGSCSQFNNANIMMDGANMQAVGEASGFEGRIMFVEATGSPQTVDAGITIKNSIFQDGCWDGIQFATVNGARGVTIGPNNEFVNILQGSCSAHVDAIQMLVGSGNAGPVITGNYFHNITHCIVMFDGTENVTVTNNVCVAPSDPVNGFNVGGATSSAVIAHNTIVGANSTVTCSNSSSGNVCHAIIRDN